MSRTVTLTVNAGVAHITLTQPEMRNAFSSTSLAELQAALDSVAQHDAVRAVVLAAEGTVFCGGTSAQAMAQMAHYTAETHAQDASQLAQVLYSLYTCPVPTLARVQGDALGSGVGLVAACDMAVAVDTAQFGLSEGKMGLVPATVAPYVLRALGPRAASRYLLTGEKWDAAAAYRWGLIDHAVPADGLDAAVDQLLKALLTTAPQAARACKRMLQEVALQPIDASLCSALPP